MDEGLDWVRLQKALAVEAERGYSDIQGKQYRFSEFLCLSLGRPPKSIPGQERDRWYDLAQKFAKYPEMSLNQRHTMVTSTRNFLSQQRTLAANNSSPPPKPKQPRTKSVAAETKTNPYSSKPVTLDQTLYTVVGIGGKGRYLERVGLYTVRDL